MANAMDLEHKHGLTKLFTLAIGKTTNRTVKESLHILVAIIIKEIGSIPRRKVWENMSSKMAMFTRVHGSMTNLQGMDSSQQ